METKQEYKIGDCVELMQELPDECIDLVITSPPYDNLREYGGYNFNLQRTIDELYRIIKHGSCIVWVVGDSTICGSETGNSFRQALAFIDTGFNLHDTMIYQKLNYVPLTHARYEQSFEYMFVFSKDKPETFNPIMVPCKGAGKIEKYGQDRRQNHGKNHSMRLYNETTFIATKETKIAPNIFSYTVGKEKTGHPAAFPDQLAKDHILSWSNEGDLVLDPFLGSGTVLKMCKELNRNGLGFECNPEYETIIKGRVPLSLSDCFAPEQTDG